MYTLATILAILCVNPCVLVDSNLAINAIQRFASAFTVEPVNDVKLMTLGFFRNSVRFAHAQLKNWAYEGNGIVRFDTLAGNWFRIKCNALVSPFKFTKVVYRYTELWDEVPSWFHGKAVDMGGVYELHLTDSFFVPDGEWNKEQDACVDSLKEEGDFIFKGEVTIRESLLEALKPIAKRYNSYGEFGFSARRETKREAMSLATNRDEKDFIRWYLMSR